MLCHSVRSCLTPCLSLNESEVAIEKLATGNLKSLIGYDEADLDNAGNVELRCWAAAAGALGERKPDIVAMEPSWHHNYASLGWFGAQPRNRDPHYPSIKPELVELTTALHGLAHDEELRRQYLANGAAYADRFRLTPSQRAALLGILYHRQRRAILDRAARVEELGLAVDVAPRRRRGGAQLDQRRVADALDETRPDVHALLALSPCARSRTGP